MAVTVIILLLFYYGKIIGSGLGFHNTFPSVIFMYEILKTPERKIERKKSH